MQLLRSTALFAALAAFVGTASAQVTVSIDQAPDRVRAGETFEVVWTIGSPDPVELTTVAYGSQSRGWNQYGSFRAGSAGTFRTQVTAPATPGPLYWTVYVRTRNARGVIPERQITVEAATPSGFGLERREPRAALSFPIQGAQLDTLRREVAFPSLSFNSPLFLTAPPDGTNRVAVVEQGGRIKIFPNRDSVTSASTFLDISGRTRAGGELGLLGLAFSPNYASDGRFYVYYSPSGGSTRTRISRFTVSGDPNRADANSEEVLLEIDQPFSNHNGGSLNFGPDGYLYVGVGDGGSAGDPQQNGQNLGTLLGSILRLDVSPQTGYRIPGDNPFQGAGQRREIYAYGIRNPWRFSFDRSGGDLWLGDVGQNNREEVDIVVRGGNYGWRIYEGNAEYRNPQNIPANRFQRPVIDYSTAEGRTVVGGYVYRGNALPSLRGVYVYGDYVSSRVWGLRYQNGQVTWRRELTSVPNLSSFGEDEAGELYATSLSTGRIYRFSANTTGGQTFPSTLSQTGLFQDLASLTPASGVVPYDVNAPLWSDGAKKKRWIALPDNTEIDFSATGSWQFPVGTVLVKHFELELEEGNPASAVRLETRVLIHEQQGWAGYTYKWNDQQTEANLLPGGSEQIYTVRDAGGAQRRQTWAFPSRADCMSCHTVAAGFVLGVGTRQLNRDFDYAARTDNQLRSWNHIGLFSRNIGDAQAYEAYVDPFDTSVDLARRARTYLAVNCSSCHQPNGGTPRRIDLRFDTSRTGMNLIDQRPEGEDLGIQDPYLVRPFQADQSILLARMNRRDVRGMPLLGSRVIHGEGVQLIRDWIEAGAR
ncbi:MAG: PQQ-dependent sugar dehydrogenase [Planctomycetota bacterium]